jgi:hypothetical protein
MGNESSILAWRIVLWAAPIIGGLIALLANYKIDRLDTENKKEKEKIEAIRTEEREKKLYSLFTDSINKKKSSKPRKKMEEKNKSGDTYNVTSNNQKGGITAGKVDIHNTTIKVEEDINAFDIDDNWAYDIDASNKQIRIWPKKGKWKNAIIAYPENEQSTVKAEFGCATNVFVGNTSEGFIDIENKRYAFFETVQPFTHENFFIFKYEVQPSIIRFGQNRLFYAGIKKQ